MINRIRIRCSILAVGALAFCALALSASAQTPAPVEPPPVAPVAAVAPVPVAPPAPVAPVQQVPPVVVNRREEEPVVQPPAPTGATPPPNLAQRVNAAVASFRGQTGIAGQLAERDQRISSLTATNGQLTSQVAAMQAELLQLRTERTQIEQALATAERANSTVTETVAALGFDPARLPGTGSIEQVAAGSVEDLQGKLKIEGDSDKRSEIAAQIIALRDKKKAA